MTIEELAKFDGCEGRAAYVAINDIIYDVSSSQRWKNGHHEGTHQAGRDLTEELKHEIIKVDDVGLTYIIGGQPKELRIAAADAIGRLLIDAGDVVERDVRVLLGADAVARPAEAAQKARASPGGAHTPKQQKPDRQHKEHKKLLLT